MGAARFGACPDGTRGRIDRRPGNQRDRHGPGRALCLAHMQGKGLGTMAMSASRGAAQQLHGTGRLAATMGHLLARPQTARLPSGKVPSRWLIERGSVRAAATVDVHGGFPGSIRTGNRLPRTSAIVSARYLVVGEGTADGFALPLDDILSAGLVRVAGQPVPGLVVRYREEDRLRVFGLEFRGLTRTLAGRWRAEEVLAALAGCGVPVADERRIGGPARLKLTWEEAEAFAGEDLRWSGLSTASVGGWFGARRSCCRVWLTCTSLFWCCRQGSGVNRLPLADISGVQAGPYSTVLVATTDAAGCAYEVPFRFELAVNGQSADMQRAGFLEHLRAAGLAVRPAMPPLAPWRAAGGRPR